MAAAPITWVEPGGGEVSAASDALARLRAGDPLLPATVTVPGAVAGLQLRRALGAGGGVAAVDVVPLLRFAQRLAPPAAVAHTGVGGAWEEAVRLALAASPGPFRGVEHHPATVERVAVALRRLHVATADEQAVLAERTGRSAHLVRLLRTVEAQGPWPLGADALRSAAEVVESGADTGIVVVVRPDLTDPLAVRLVRALVQAGGRTAVLAPPSRTAARALGVDAPPHPEPPVPQELVVAADAESEARLAVQGVVAALAAGTPGHRISVLPLGDRRARHRLAQLLDAAAITWNGPTGTTLADSAAGRVVLGLLRAAALGWTHGGVLAALAAAPVVHPLRGGPLPLDRWAAVARAARVVRGADQWVERPRRLAARLEAGRGVLGSPAPPDPADALDLADAMERMVDLVGRTTSGASWEARTAGAVALLDALTEADRWPEGARSEHQAVRAALGGLAALDGLGGVPDDAAFLAATERALAAATPRHGRVGHGVHLATAGELPCATPDLLIVTGVVEGAAPARRPDDPLLPDEEVVHLSAAAGRGERRAAERAALDAALASAAHAVASCHRSDAQAERLPSRWFLEWAGLKAGTGRPLSESELRRTTAPWLRTVPSFTAAVCGDPEAAATAQEAALAGLARWTAAGAPAAGHPVGATPAVAAALDRLLALDGAVFGPHHGRVAPGLDLGEEMSASALESWATCPRQHLLRHILAVGEVDEPDDALAIDGLDRGALVHGALEAVVGAHLGRRPDEPWTEAERAEGEAALRRRVRDLQQVGLLSGGVLVDLAVDEMAAVVRAVLDHDDRLRAEEQWVPVEVEAAFGVAYGRPVAVELPSGRTVRFRGRIDRVDTSAGGTRRRLVDYKTGKGTRILAAANDEVAAARLLQLGIYEAAERAAHPGADVSSGWWLVEASANGKDRRGIVQNHLSPDHLVRAVDAIADGIAGGVFPADPGADGFFGPASCRFCPYDGVCHTDRVRHLEQIADDPVLEPWRRLRVLSAEVAGAGDPR